MIVHADLSEEAEITLDGGDLRAVSRPGHGDLEVHVLALDMPAV